MSRHTGNSPSLVGMGLMGWRGTKRRFPTRKPERRMCNIDSNHNIVLVSEPMKRFTCDGKPVVVVRLVKEPTVAIWPWWRTKVGASVTMNVHHMDGPVLPGLGQILYTPQHSRPFNTHVNTWIILQKGRVAIWAVTCFRSHARCAIFS